MTNASPAAQQFAKTMQVTGSSVAKFTSQQNMTELSLMAQNKSLSSIRFMLDTYNNSLSQLDISQQEFIQGVGQSNTVLGRYLDGLNGAEATLGGYIGKLISTKLATIGLQAATTALNAVIGMGIGFITSFVTSGISKLLVSIKNTINDTEVLREKTQEITQAFKTQQQTLSDTKSRLDSLIPKYQSLSKGVDGLNKSVSLSHNEYSEYLDVCNQIGTMFPSLIQGYDDQGNVILTLKGNVEGLTQAYNDMVIAANSAILAGGKTVFKDFKNQTEDFNKSNLKGNDITLKTAEKLNKISNSSNIEVALKQYSPTGSETTKQIVKALKDKGLKQEEGTWRNLWADGESAHDFIKRAVQESPQVVDAIVKEWNTQVSEATKNMTSLAEAYINNSMLIGNYSQITSDMKGVISSIVSSFNYEFYDSFDSVAGLYDYLNGLLNSFGDLSSDQQEKFEFAFNAKTELNNGNCTIGEYLDRINDVKKVISEFDSNTQAQIELLLNDEDVKSKIKTLTDGKDNGFISWINELTGEQLEIAYQISLDTESANYALDEWKTKVENYEIPEELKISFSNLMADENFSNSIDNYIDKIATLQNALESLHKGEFENSDFVELVKQFPVLANDANNLENAIITLIDSMNNDTASEFVSQFNKLDTSEDVEALQNFMDAVLELGVIVGNTEFAIDIEAETNGMNNLWSAMKESISSTGLTAEGIKNLKERYKDLENYDAARLFEKTTNGIHLNTKALRELESEYEKQKKSDIGNTLDDLIEKYNELSQEINKADNAAKTAELYAQRNDILDQINDTANLAAMYDGLTSAFYKWEQAQSIGEEGDMYDSLAGSLEDIKKLFDEGLIGTNKFRTAVQLMSNEDLSTASIDELLSAYNAGYETMTRYFQDSSDGCLNFLQDVQNLNSEWVHMNKDGSWNINFGVGNDQEIADALGINVESIQSILRKLSDYGFNINLDSVFSNLNLLGSYAEKANDKLKELGKTEITFNFGTDDIEYLNDQIEKAKFLLDDFRNSDGTIDLKLEGAEDAQTVLISLVSQKQALSAPEIMQLDTSSLNEADQALSDTVSSLQEFVRLINDLEIQTELGVDTAETQQKLQSVASDIDSIPNEIKTKLGIDSEEFTAAIKDIAESEVNIEASISVSEETISSVRESIDRIKVKDIELLTNSSNVINELDGINEYAIADKNFSVIIKDKASSVLRSINSYIRSIPNGKTITVKTVSGTDSVSEVQGTAYANGSCGTKNSGTALGGEIDEELVVRNGKFFTIGSNGAELFTYKKGDIIFNAEQTRQILANGKITSGKRRGATYAGGAAFSSGSNPGQIIVSGNVKTTPSGSKKSDKSDSETINWIEIAINRIERAVDKLKTTATSTYKALKTKLGATYDEITKVNEELEIQQKAYDRYVQQANSVGLSSDLAEKVHSGAIDISEYDKETAELIKDYQDWYLIMPHYAAMRIEKFI